MSSIVDSVNRVVTAIGEITQDAREQGVNVSSIHLAINRLDQMTQQNAAVVEDSAAAAQSLQDQAGDLRDVAGQFRLPNMALLALN
jgi:methyl-accepting chemotaxis protein